MQQIILHVILDFAPYACTHLYCLQTKKPLLLELFLYFFYVSIKEINVNPGHAFRRQKRVVMEQRGRFPSGSEFLLCFNTNGFWLIHKKKKKAHYHSAVNVFIQFKY